MAQRQHFKALIASATAEDSRLVALADRGLDQFMVARLDVNKLLGRHDAAAATAAEKDFTELNTTLEGLDAATKETAHRATLDDLRAGVAAYREAFHKVNALEGEINGMVNGTMRDMGQTVLPTPGRTLCGATAAAEGPDTGGGDGAPAEDAGGPETLCPAQTDT